MTRKRNVPSYSPGYRRAKLRIAGILEVRRLAVVLGVLAGAVGCRATVPPAAEVETVGALSASASHVYTAPVHATTDLTPQFGAVDTGDDVSASVTTVTRAPEGEASDLPEVAHKTDGVTLGGVR